MGTHQRRAVGAAAPDPGPGDLAQCRRHRQPVRENDGNPGVRGYDAAKKVEGRKRHLVVGTLGLPLKVVVHAPDIQDRDGARLVLEGLRDDCPRLRVVWGDGGYQGPKLGDWVQEQGTWHPADCPPRPRRGRLQGGAQALDRGAHLCQAGVPSPPGQGLRGPRGFLRILDPHRHGPVHAQAPRLGLTALSNPGVGWTQIWLLPTSGPIKPSPLRPRNPLTNLRTCVPCWLVSVIWRYASCSRSFCSAPRPTWSKGA